MNPIKPEDLFSTDFTEKLDDIIAKLEVAMGTLNTKMESVKTTAKGLANVKFSGTAAEDTRKWANSVLALNDEYRYLLSQFNVTKSTIAELTTVERDQNQILKLQQQYAEAATGSFNKMSAEYRLLKIAMNAINQEAVGNTDAFKKLQKRTEELYDTMNKYQKSTGKFTMQVGDYSRALNGLQLSTQQVLREVPTLANSLQQFFIAISNNVPIFVDNFKRAREEMGSFSAALKGTLSAVFSWQTALLVLLTILPKIAKAIRDKKKAQEEANKETKEAFDREKELLSLEETIARSEQKSIAQLQALYSITQDVTRSEKERTEAAEALQKMYPERLANLSQEEILAGNAKTAIDDLTNSLVLQARARGYLNEIEKLSEQAAEKQIALAKHKNVYIESGGLTWLFHKEFYPYPSAIDAILEARDLCGMDKLMWGSDYPRTMTAITYRMSWDFVAKSPLLTEEEKYAFFHANAESFYRFEGLPDMPYIHHMAE